MKRSFAKIVLIAAILVMVLGCASVFAAEEVATVKTENESSGLKLNAGEDMSAATINYSTSKYNDSTTISTPGGDSYYRATIGVKATGKLYVDAEAYSTNAYSVSIIVGSSTDGGATVSYYTSKTGYVSPGKIERGIGCYDVKPGTYYVLIKSSSAAKAWVSAYVVPYNTRSLKAGKVMVASGVKATSDNITAPATGMFKIKATKTGYIRVGIQEAGYSSSSAYVTLLNSKKKTVSDKLSFVTDSKYSYVVFGVKKGKTYYLKVTDASGSYTDQYMYGVIWKSYKATYKSNTSKKKAVTLKRKAKAKKMVKPATGKKMTQWYKFKVTKKRKTVLSFDASMIKSGTVKLTLYCGKKKIGSTKTIANGEAYNYKITNSTTWYKANKGTYYVKVATSAKCSGMYKVRYKC